MKYNHSKTEKKWQEVWLKEKVYEPHFDDLLRLKATEGQEASRGKPDLKNTEKPDEVEVRQRRPFYNLMMFPYPSAEGLHVGNMYAFTGSDIYGRLKRMQGYDVFEPIGLDGFGIHSENYALKIGKHPADQAKISEKNFYRQLGMIGNGFAWNEKLETYDPEYYKWTQWIFTQMYKNGLAYRKKSAVNWCTGCLTVLADEQVISAAPSGGEPRQGRGECERCGSKVIKKELEQWFFRITKYADKLLKGLGSVRSSLAEVQLTRDEIASETSNGIDWSEKVKIAQRNWIGKSEGATIKFPVVIPAKAGIQTEKTGSRVKPGMTESIEVFTTRPDTLFGATFMAVSVELAQKWISEGWQAGEDVRDYIKSHKENIGNDTEKEKTGVFTGLNAINPVNNKEIPIWVADYVLSGYGSGAVMCVPAHDERDWEFAQKFDLKVKQVILKRNVQARSYIMGTESIYEKDLKDIGVNILEKTKEGYFKVEIPENSLADYEKLIKEKMTPGFWNEYIGKEIVFIFKYKDGHVEKLVLNDETEQNIDKLASTFVGKKWNKTNVWKWLAENSLYKDIIIHTENGSLINSGKFNGMDSEKAKWEITKLVGGEKEIQYRLRDWLISRQRYWGAPIPLVFCENCAEKIKNQKSNLKIKEEFNIGELENPGWIAVSEKDLPVKLPYIKEFRPTGTDKSPLASDEKFYKTKCPKCDGSAKRETDVSDTFLDSAWYYIGYLFLKNSKSQIPNLKQITNSKFEFPKEIIEKWCPVDMYIGGAEHSVLHLLYVRFLAMVFKDLGITNFSEPFKKFRAHGLLIKDGAKMSKSKGNVINPDDYIKQYGADVLRMYLMFLGPFDQGGDFRDEGIRGITRFLERVWKLSTKFQITNNKQIPLRQGFAGQENSNIQKAIHKTIKKVTEDIENLNYNTAVSALMILLNDFESNQDSIGKKEIEAFLQLLAPFAPHLSEELWREVLKNKKSIHISEFPKYDPEIIKESEVDIVVQINGKMRAVVKVKIGSEQTEVEKIAKGDENVSKYITGEVKKVIFVKDRLINFVII